MNYDKVESGVEGLEFLGYHISGNGISVSSTKLKAIEQLRSPKSAEEVRSFLGLVNFVHRYVPNMATVTHCLNLLTKKGTKFE